MNIPAFPKIFQVGERFTTKIWDNPVEITEKVDGSQFSFGRRQGIVYMRSKSAPIFYEDENKMFQEAKDFVKGIEDKLPEGLVFHGEYLNKPKHNTLMYQRVPKGYIALFGITGIDLDDSVEGIGSVRGSWADKFGCDVVPILYQGMAPGGDRYEWLINMIHQESGFGLCRREGIVIKNYYQEQIIGGQVIPIMSAKIVSNEFKEKHKVSWNAGAGRDRIEVIGAAYNAKPRWEKMIQRLRDENKLEGSPRDIGPLLKQIHMDIEEEEKENIKDLLWNIFSKDIKRIATRGFPEYYKDKLVHQLTGEDSDGTEQDTLRAVLPASEAAGRELDSNGTESDGNTRILPQHETNNENGAQEMVSEVTQK